jgi:hypothetical protein
VAALSLTRAHLRDCLPATPHTSHVARHPSPSLDRSRRRASQTFVSPGGTVTKAPLKKQSSMFGLALRKLDFTRPIDDDDLAPVLNSIKDSLMSKNVVRATHKQRTSNARATQATRAQRARNARAAQGQRARNARYAHAYHM